ncbi:MAG: glutamate-cysteine ligase family protein [Elusimicrobiota bacterium]
MNPVRRCLAGHERSGRRLIGIEVERFLIDKRPLRYEPDVRALLETLVSQRGWGPSHEADGKLLAIKKEGHSISVEPGGQLEVSSVPQPSISDLRTINNGIDEDIASVMAGRGAGFLNLGLNPWDAPDDVPILPSPRYRLMDKHFGGLKGRGQDMMRLSLGLQINLDYSGEGFAVEMLRGGFYTAPALSALFSNSPYFRGKKTSRLSERHFVWRETDPARCGIPAFIFDEGFGFESYGEFVCGTPLMYAFDAEGKVWDTGGRCLNDLDPKLQEVNAVPAMRQIFTEVRLKPCCVEARYFDQVPDGLRYAAVGLLTGLLYDDENRAWLNRKFAGATAGGLWSLMRTGAETGLANDELYETAKAFLAAAERGLVRRRLGEENFLADAERLISIRKTPADALPFEL